MLIYFFYMGCSFFVDIYAFSNKLAAILYFCHFPENIRFLINIALILLVVHYFDAESSEKKTSVTCKMHKITNFIRQQMAAIFYLVIFRIISVFLLT